MSEISMAGQIKSVSNGWDTLSKTHSNPSVMPNTALIMVNGSGSILSASQMFADLLGLTGLEMLGTSIFALKTPEWAPLLDFIRGCLDDESPTLNRRETETLPAPGADGGDFAFDVDVRYIPANRQKVFVFLLGNFRPA